MNNCILNGQFTLEVEKKSIKTFFMIFLILIRVKGNLPDNKNRCMWKKSLKQGNLPKI